MKRLLLAKLLLLFCFFSSAQLLTWTPEFPVENDPSQTLVITVDANKGNKGLLNYTPTSNVYVHIGVVTNFSTSNSLWQHVRTYGFADNVVFNSAIPQLQATSLGSNKWSFTIAGSLRSFFGLTDPAEIIQKIAILFRTGDGTKKQANTDGSDMFIPVYTAALATRLNAPATEPRFTPVSENTNWTVGSNFTATGVANKPATMKLYHNGTVIATQSNTQTITAASSVLAFGLQKIVVEANDGTAIKYDTVNIFVGPLSSPVAALPGAVKDGINYNGDGSVTLVLHAPGKTIVSVIGDFNNWTEDLPYVMNKTPDGQKFWITLNGLASGTEYAFQYRVDNAIKIADPYAQKVLDPSHDGGISNATYPNLKSYPAGQTGIVSIIQKGAPAYNWTVNNFTKPDKRNLIIYELHLRDFIAAHDWKTLKDTLSYIKRLGVNAIELMPFNEFEGNSSWGYNPNFYFAPDKYYGPANTLKEFIDSCHKNGIAVIMDIVLNHSESTSPLAQLYWDAANNRPAANNPWYNPMAPHSLSFGLDFNHESAATKDYMKRILEHWLTEYKIDGYRIDFSKGLTQKPSSDDAQFSAYDASRIAIIKSMHSWVKGVSPDAYMILEHLAVNAEEKELSDEGMLLWGNMSYNYQEAAMGYIPTSNLEWGIYTTRTWTKPHLVTYMESHDEERITYKNIKYGASSGNYNIKDTITALKRMELDAAFLFTYPGPKMIWQFGELGYDYSRCYLSTNGEDGNCNTKLDPKPIRWNYQNEARRKAVYNVYSNLIKLRNHNSYKNAFVAGNTTQSLTDTIKWIKLTTDTSKLMVIGNFGIRTKDAVVSFPEAGTWYDYLNNNTFSATGNQQTINLQPGEYRVYLNRNVNNLNTTPNPPIPPTPPIVDPPVVNSFEAFVYPNPVRSDFTIKIVSPQSGNVTIDLINMVGQKVKTMGQSLSAGENKLFFNRKAWSAASGVYFIRINSKWGTKTLGVTLQ